MNLLYFLTRYNKGLVVYCFLSLIPFVGNVQIFNIYLPERTLVLAWVGTEFVNTVRIL